MTVFYGEAQAPKKGKEYSDVIYHISSKDADMHHKWVQAIQPKVDLTLTNHYHLHIESYDSASTQKT